MAWSGLPQEDVRQAQEMAQMVMWTAQNKGKGKEDAVGMMQDMMYSMGAKSGKGKGAGGSGDAARGGRNGRFSWKGALNQAWGKTHKRSATKGTIVYNTLESNGMYVSSVTCDDFKAPEHLGEGPSKKTAEEAAAEAALREEFPAFAGAADTQSGGQAEAGEDYAWQGDHSWYGGGPDMMSMYGMYGGKGGASTSRAEPNGATTWKAQLNAAYGKKHKICNKGSIVYEVEEQENAENAKIMQYVCTVSSEDFSSTYTGEPGLSKKQAENSAAMLALQGEFPDFQAEAPPQKQHVKGKGKGKEKGWGKDSYQDRGWGNDSAWFWENQAPGVPFPPGSPGHQQQQFQQQQQTQNQAWGEARGWEAVPPEQPPLGSDPKSRLNSAYSKLSSIPFVKGDIEYVVTEEDGKSVAVVTLRSLTPEASFTSEAVDGISKKSKKLAENSAAEVALEALKEQIEGAEAEHAEKKAQQSLKRKAVFLERRQEKQEKRQAKGEGKGKSKGKSKAGEEVPDEAINYSIEEVAEIDPRAKKVGRVT